MIRIYKEAPTQRVYSRSEVFFILPKTLRAHPRPLSKMVAERPNVCCI
jgi:hypothetical protein